MSGAGQIPQSRSAIERLWVQARQAESRSDWSTALAAYRQAETLDPGNPIFPTNRANVLWWANRSHEPEALAASERACALAPEDPLPWRGHGNLLRDRNSYGQAEMALRRSQELRDDPATAWNRSQVLLGLECYEQAYALAERRLELERLQPFRPGPYWQGWPATRLPERLTIWSEQGFGDTLQYVRWLVPLLQQGVAVRLEVEGCLVRLMQQGLGWLPRAAEVVNKAATPPLGLVQVPCQGSLLSLPHRIGGAPLTAAVFEPGGGGYLRSPLWQQPPAGEPFGPSRKNRRPRIGLVWAAGRKFSDPFAAREYHRRSLPARELQALLAGLQRQGASLVGMQLGVDGERAGRWGKRLAARLPETSDFADTAHWIQHLDLLITVDTAYAHLAGAMGRPAWVLLPHAPDPRWLRQRADSPWYPSLLLLRQPRPGDWRAVVDAVLERFEAWRQTAGLAVDRRAF